MTWTKDSHGLFDYEYKHKVIEKYNIKKTTTFLRKGNIALSKFILLGNGIETQ